MSLQRAAATPSIATPARVPGVVGSSIARPRKRLDELAGERSIKALSVLVLIGLWSFSAALLPSSVMPSPQTVLGVLWDDMQSGEIWSDVAISLIRIVLAFSLAMSVAIVLGFAMGLSQTAERFFDVWVVGCMTLPSLVLILTIYLVVGLNEKAAVVASAVPVIPYLAINIWDGIKGVDQKLIDMARAYHAKKWQIIRSVVAPQLAPILLASTRFGLGLTWKLVLFVELIGRGSGIGYKIEFYFQTFNMSEILAHALLFMVVMLFIEIVLLGGLERRLFKWRPAQRRL
jgi:NitT/TauT family transport system permease protein